MMKKIIVSRTALQFALKYNYTPVSNYQIQNKVNPIVSVTFGTDSATLFDIHFRVK
jgi:hypothetical protein